MIHHKTGMINLAIRQAMQAKEGSMKCNMFDKPCTLLTCHTKGKCLWSKEEAERDKQQNKTS